MRGSRERVIHDEIVAMPEPREFPSVDEMEEHKESEDSQEGEEDVEEDDSETITTAEQLREVSNEFHMGRHENFVVRWISDAILG